MGWTHGHNTETSAPVSIHLSPLWFSSLTLGNTTPEFLRPPSPPLIRAAGANPSPVPSVDLPFAEYKVSPPIVGVEAAAGPPCDLSSPFSDEFAFPCVECRGKMPNIPRSCSPAAKDDAESRLLVRFRRRRHRIRKASRARSWGSAVFWDDGTRIVEDGQA